MSTSDFTDSKNVLRALADLRDSLAQQGGLNVSDVRDEAGHQYVDLVQEGGGVLGIALVGFTYVLEEVGIRFVNLGGTSAGSINTALLAALGKPQEEKSLKILKELVDLDLMTFVDGGNDARSLVNVLGSNSLFKKILVGLGQVDDLVRGEIGINRGDSFLEWLRAIISKHGVKTTGELMECMNAFPEELGEEFREHHGRKLKARMAIIASELTTQTKVEFPRMSDLYFVDPEETDPALYVRASMSIPFFFDPLVVKDIPQGGSAAEKEERQERWRDRKAAFHFGEIPEEAVFVDGGVLSNFPIDVFHTQEGIVPSRPTFGIKLGVDRLTLRENDTIFKLAWNSFSAAQQMRDHEVILRHEELMPLIANINVDGLDWLNFSMSKEEKLDLFERGVSAACEFLKMFDWNAYKDIRREARPEDAKFESGRAVPMAYLETLQPPRSKE